MNSEILKKDEDSKKIFTLIILIFTLMICTTSATYAYFAFTANNNNVVKGTAAVSGLTLTVTEQTLGGTKSGATKTNVMVPQLESALGTAMGSDYKCIDANGNTVCKVYKITIANPNMTATMPITGTIKFTSTMPNLKWKLVSNATTIGSVGTATVATLNSAQSFATPTLSSTNKTYTYYIVIWINEINSAQTDSGSWAATIAFNPTDGSGGLTSTIKS